MSEFLYLYRGGDSSGYPRADAEAHAEVGGLAEGARRRRDTSRTGQAARAHRQGRGGHRRRSPTARSPRRRTSSAATRSSRPKDIAQAVELSAGCPIFDTRRVRRSAPGHEDDHVMELGDHLFRRESGRMVAALTRIFGVHNLALAEDVVQDAFCRALEVWKLRGVPDNPSAWLMATAKNRALDVLRRERTARTFAPELGALLESEWTLGAGGRRGVRARTTIRDEQLRMMFSCCHPRLPEDAQVALVLQHPVRLRRERDRRARSSAAARRSRSASRAARRCSPESQRLFDLADAEFAPRLSAVQRALYLLFNEGYHGASRKSAVRADLCRGDAPGRAAAGASAGRHAGDVRARRADVPARGAAAGARRRGGRSASLVDQDRSRWDATLIANRRVRCHGDLVRVFRSGGSGRGLGWHRRCSACCLLGIELRSKGGKRGVVGAAGRAKSGSSVFGERSVGEARVDMGDEGHAFAGRRVCEGHEFSQLSVDDRAVDAWDLLGVCFTKPCRIGGRLKCGALFGCQLVAVSASSVHAYM